ncbi:hypothetical protein LEP1GSC123_1034 [Leptospira borgpetersenii str. 200701203]|uniref:Transposase domain protein n=1 Tax=Leptospira borgpetersenii str. 200701203 TaxID=1193007 RepID=M3GJK3_LEPBO|nr:hypothetical protein LEP1GSC123_1034 [Leptospira borgpetersenii str. 200701203]
MGGKTKAAFAPYESQRKAMGRIRWFFSIRKSYFLQVKILALYESLDKRKTMKSQDSKYVGIDCGKKVRGCSNQFRELARMSTVQHNGKRYQQFTKMVNLE